MYADDTTLYCKAATLCEVQNILQTNLDSLEQWLFSNQLTVNVSKSAVMIVNNKLTISSTNINVTLNNSNLTCCDQIKLLGIIIDNKLSWKFHIENMHSNIAPKLGLLYRLSSCLPQPQLRIIYNTLIQSLLDYGITIWGTSNKMNLEILQKLQNRCARLVTGIFDHNISSASILHNLNWLNVQQRYNYFIGIYMYKIHNNLITSTVTTHFMYTCDTHSYPTRAAVNYNYSLPLPKCEVFKRSLVFYGPKLWNSLSYDLKNCSDLLLFKKLYKDFIMNNE
jgi:hypothetical protein